MGQSGRGQVSAEGPDPIDVEVGHNLRQARLARGYTQTELSDALGISFQQVQKYERGTNRLSASRLVRAARFLRIRVVDLLPADDQQPLPEMVSRLTSVPGLTDIIDAYCATSDPALRRAVLTLLRAVKAKVGAAISDPADESA